MSMFISVGMGRSPEYSNTKSPKAISPTGNRFAVFSPNAARAEQKPKLQRTISAPMALESMTYKDANRNTTKPAQPALKITIVDSPKSPNGKSGFGTPTAVANSNSPRYGSPLPTPKEYDLTPNAELIQSPTATPKGPNSSPEREFHTGRTFNDWYEEWKRQHPTTESPSSQIIITPVTPPPTPTAKNSGWRMPSLWKVAVAVTVVLATAGWSLTGRRGDNYDVPGKPNFAARVNAKCPNTYGSKAACMVSVQNNTCTEAYKSVEPVRIPQVSVMPSMQFRGTTQGLRGFGSMPRTADIRFTS